MATKRKHMRSYALLSADDAGVVTCRFKASSKKGQYLVSLGKEKTPCKAFCAGSIPLAAPGVTLEIWQTKEFTHHSTVKDTFNVPLLGKFIVFPVIFRVLAQSQDTLPTVGKSKRLLCEHLAQTLQEQLSNFEDEEEEEVVEGVIEEEEEEEEEEEIPETEESEEGESESGMSASELEEDTGPEEEEYFEDVLHKSSY